MVPPRRASVRPRVYAHVGGTLVLEEQVLELIAAGKRGAIALVGKEGAGKTTALQHLAAIVPENAGVVLLDEPDQSQVEQFVHDGMVVYSAVTPLAVSHLAIHLLAPWTRDELIEYLLAEHKDSCAAVMARISQEDLRLLSGAPHLWRIVLDGLAADPKLVGADRTLCRFVERGVGEPRSLRRLRQSCLMRLALGQPPEDFSITIVPHDDPGLDIARALAHPVVQRLLATEEIADDLRQKAPCTYLVHRLPWDLVDTAGLTLAGDRRALHHLHALLDGNGKVHAMAASLLHAAGINWIPPKKFQGSLEGAYLAKACWAKVSLQNLSINDADLSGANLRSGNLFRARAVQVNFRGAVLKGATLEHGDFTAADFSDAELTEARAIRSNFSGAKLENANLDGGVFTSANFEAANLNQAKLQGDFADANFTNAGVTDADFTNADLSESCLNGLDLRETNLTGANLSGAELEGAILEHLVLPSANFAKASLVKALLTGTVIPSGNFDGADLREAGMAEIEWEDASLRNADLRGVSFHLGSSRSGRVGSPIACEGSRTGFYTDDYDEQSFKAPEEIRKANLCRADLRGARIDDVDFYLVDLRGARYDPAQERILRQSGAILKSRV
ncbi:MAG: pentapeptide repeat-containing protein [Planctomycetes bacterium]|nr:pentapeptide repeat-containing protein [Planctomycetota bacterium]